MKKLTKRSAAVLLALPLMAGGAAVLATPAHASTVVQCSYEPPAARGGSIDAPAAPSKDACARTAYTPPAPPKVTVTERDIEARSVPSVYSPEAAYHREMSAIYQQHAQVMTWYTIFVTAALAIVVGLVAWQMRDTKTKTN
jgi:hypothetical protein